MADESYCCYCYAEEDALLNAVHVDLDDGYYYGVDDNDHAECIDIVAALDGGDNALGEDVASL